MFAHASARESECNTRRQEKQRAFLGDALASVQASLRVSGEVRLKRYANNELRITFPQQMPPAKRCAGENPLGGGFEDANASLVYNDKVQQTGFCSESERSRRRPMKLTRYAAHTLREACSIVEAEFGQDSYFVTLTLPGSTPESLAAAAEHASGMLNAFMQRIRHEFNGKCSSLYAAGVWEYQKRGALHFHLLIGLKDAALVEQLRSHHQRWWRKILKHYSKKTNVDLFARKEGGTWKNYKDKPRTEFAKVRKSVTRYMSKYLSKSAREITSEGWHPPAAWHYVSEPVWERVKAERQMNALAFISRQEAENVAADLAEIGQEFGGKIFPMTNPFTNRTCGYVLFFDNGEKDSAWAELNQVLEGWRAAPEALYRRASPFQPDWSDQSTDVEFAKFIFDGVPLDTVPFGCADLCAPFSASEKGGGMR